ncbi:MAG: NAD(P)H-binding protein [Cypionkella sp.]|nr:NAD(P)H-binding protein [Cypionkella sp.]
MTKIAITGATGQLGRLAIKAILARDPQADVLGLARNVSADVGAPLRAMDYTKPDTLAPALAGVDVLVLISSSDFNDRAGQHRAVVLAAAAAKVGRIVYTSILKGVDNPMILAQDHIATEAAIAGSGLMATILRNGWYTENYTASLGGALAAGAMIGSSGQGRISSAARADYAEAIAVVALDAAHAGKVYELAGDTAHTMAEFAAEVGQQAGKTIGYNDLTPEVYAQTLVNFGLPEGFAMVLADCDAKARDGALFDDSRNLSRLIGRPTTAIALPIAAALRA